MRHLVGPRHQRAMQECRRRGREVRQIRTHVGQRLGADRQDLTVPGAAQLDLRHMVATMRVGQEAFGPLRCPAHRAAQLLRRSQNQRLFAVVIDLRAEAAAHVGGHHGQLVLRNAQHEGRYQKPRQVRVLAGRRQLVVPCPRVVLADRGPGLHRIRDQPIVHQVQRHDMRGRLHRRIDRRAVIFDPAPVEADVVRDLVMDAVRGIGHRSLHVDDGRQLLDHRILGQLLRCILCLGDSLGNHGRVGVAHMPHLAMRQHRALGFAHRGAIAAVDQPARRVAADVLEILTGEDRQHARHRRGLGGIDLPDPPMRHIRPHEHRRGLRMQRHVVGINPATGQKADILAALRRRANSMILRHPIPPIPLPKPRRPAHWQPSRI